ETFLSPQEALQQHNNSVNQRIKEKFIGRHVYSNTTSMVCYILEQDDISAPFSSGDIENYSSYPEYIRQYANFEGGNYDQLQEEIQRLNDPVREKTALQADSGHNPDELQSDITLIMEEVEDLED